MKKVYLTLIALLAVISASAQGWPANYNGVMLQGFSWNAYEAHNGKLLRLRLQSSKDSSTSYGFLRAENVLKPYR